MGKIVSTYMLDDAEKQILSDFIEKYVDACSSREALNRLTEIVTTISQTAYKEEK